MKKYLKYLTLFAFILILKSICPGKLLAQGIFDYLYYGVKGGANYTYFYSSQPHTAGNTGYSAGFTVEMRRYRRIFIVSGISYVKEGGRYVQIVDNGFRYFDSYVASNNISLHNIDIPLMARIFLRDGKKFLPYIYFGPSLLMNLQVSNDFERTLYLTPGQLTFAGYSDISSEFKQFSASFNLGIGSEVLIANQSILFEVAYRHGLSPVSSAYSFLGDGRLTNPLYVDGIQLNIAYNF